VEDKDTHEIVEDAQEAREHAHGGNKLKILTVLVISALALGSMFSSKSAEHAQHGATSNLIQSQDKWTEFGTNSVKAHQIESSNQQLEAIDKLGGALDKLGGAVDKLVQTQAETAATAEAKQAVSEASKDIADFRAALGGLHDTAKQTLAKNNAAHTKYETTKDTTQKAAVQLQNKSNEESSVELRFATVGSFFVVAITLATLSMAIAASGGWVSNLLLVGAVVLGLLGGSIGYGPRMGFDIAPVIGFDFSADESDEPGAANAPAEHGAVTGEHDKATERGHVVVPDSPSKE
jgi:hypothetical protein